MSLSSPVFLKSPFERYLDTNYTPSREDAAMIRMIIEGQDYILQAIDAQLHRVETEIVQLQLTQTELSSYRTVHKNIKDRHSALLSEVFQASVPTAEEWQGLVEAKFGPHPVVALTHVCRQWRELALNTPLLWTNVPVDPLLDYFEGSTVFLRSMAKVVEMVTAFVSRASLLPITFSLTGMDPNVFDDPGFSTTVSPLINALRRAQWADVTLDLRFHPAASPYARLIPVPPQSQNTIRRLKVYHTGPGASAQREPVLDFGGSTPRRLTHLEVDVPGHQLCDMQVNWAALTHLAIGPISRHPKNRTNGFTLVGPPTLTPVQALQYWSSCGGAYISSGAKYASILDQTSQSQVQSRIQSATRSPFLVFIRSRLGGFLCQKDSPHPLSYRLFNTSRSSTNTTIQPDPRPRMLAHWSSQFGAMDPSSKKSLSITGV
ncbi:hypothetical protein FA13DRAFT_163333 [Coprinellus micaceus]|uniref:Uncharacterized protein n=1 Tax=Coprinellus micaceus TaxID=71717 RepID=A0A4Y7TI03_COPMI|nr:hypothetical protein FA13DRAFT_163333 [Coprinellus micaceus]